MTEDAAAVAERKASKDLIVTYRVLRIGIVFAVVMLGCTLIREIYRVDGSVRGSISAYYYSPARSVFVGGLMAIGLCLIAIRGTPTMEEVFLNAAGLFAPVVALVPTAPGTCEARPLATESITITEGNPIPLVTVDAVSDFANRNYCVPKKEDLLPGEVARDGLPGWVITNIQNNAFALLVVGSIALGLVVWFAIKARRAHQQDVAAKSNVATFGVYAVLLLVGLGLYVTFDGEKSTSHYFAAFAMFGCFGVVAWLNGWRTNAPSRFRASYRAVFGGMVLTLAAFGAYKAGIHWLDWGEWGKEVFVLEVIEILLFGVFWGVQTAQLWNKTDT